MGDSYLAWLDKVTGDGGPPLEELGDLAAELMRSSLDDARAARQRGDYTNARYHALVAGQAYTLVFAQRVAYRLERQIGRLVEELDP